MELKLTVEELLILEGDLDKALTNEMEFSNKILLLDIYDVVEDSLKNFKKVREELFRKYGEVNQETGQINVKMFKDDSNNEYTTDYIELNQELSKLVIQEKTIDFEPIPFEVLKNVRINSNGKVLRKLIKS